MADRSALSQAVLHHDREIMRMVEARDGSAELDQAYSDAVRAMDRNGLTPDLLAAWAHLSKFRHMINPDMSPGEDARRAFTGQYPGARWPDMMVSLVNTAHRGEATALHRVAARVDTLDGVALSHLFWELSVLAHTARTVGAADTAEACALVRNGNVDAFDAFLLRVADEEPGLMGLVISWLKLISLTSRSTDDATLTSGEWSLDRHPLSSYVQALVDGDRLGGLATITSWIATVQRDQLRQELLPIVDRVADILDAVGGEERLRASLLLHASYFSAGDARVAQRAAVIAAAAANGRHDCVRDWTAAALTGLTALRTLTGAWLQMAAESTGLVAAQMTVIGLDGVPEAGIDVSDLAALDMAQPEQREAWRLYHGLALLQTGDLDRFSAAMDAAGTDPDDPYTLLAQLPVTVGSALLNI